MSLFPPGTPMAALKLALVVAVIAMSGTAPTAHGYEVGCIYPPGMPDPMEVQDLMIKAGALDQMKNKVETPVAVHNSIVSALCGTGCLAYHDAAVLNPLTMARPLLVVPEYGHNAYSIAMCSLQCHTIAYAALGNPQDGTERVNGLSQENNPIQPLLDKWGIDDVKPAFHPSLVAIAGGLDREPTTEDFLGIATVLNEEDYHPYLIGMLVVGEILISHIRNSGWNHDGVLSYDVATGETIRCRANCMPYSDVTGYQPRNTPGRKESFQEATKYNVSGNDMYWQPLLEDDGFGYFSRQESVVPHIGTTGRLNLNSSDAFRQSKTLPPPDYDYRTEALQVVEEMRLTGEDQHRQLLITTFDNKFEVRGFFQHETSQQFSDQHSYQRHLLYVLGLSYAEDDAVILAWKEKVAHDLVRPTTVIQRWGSDTIRVYRKGADRARSMDARNFEAFIRVMPHAEYPSGSSCLCTTYREYVDAFTQEHYGGKLGDNNQAFKYGQEIGGFQANCNGEVSDDLPAVGCTGNFTLASMTELEDICGQSRLWGGMHFTKSVPAGHELCTDLGTMALERIRTIMAETDFSGNEWFVDDARPACSDPNLMAYTNTSVSKDAVSAANRLIPAMTLVLLGGMALLLAVAG